MEFFVEVLNDLELLKNTLYMKMKYSTADRIEIVMVRNWISLMLTKLLLEKYRRYVTFKMTL